MTRLSSCLLALLALASSGLAPRPAQAAESYDNCDGTIDSVPITISTPGTWCMKQDLAMSATNSQAIRIQSDDVVIDCNHYTLDGSGAGLATLSTGISAVERHGITVRHCNVRGFYIGIGLTGAASSASAIEDNRVSGNTFTGIFADGSNVVIRRNQVLDTGGSTHASVTQHFGIYANPGGGAVDILDNTVAGVIARVGGQGAVYGIRTQQAVGTVSDNRVRGLVRDGTGEASGIYMNSAVRAVVRNNVVISEAGNGVYGLVCPNSNTRTKDNVINGFVTPIINCSNDGNVIKP